MNRRTNKTHGKVC